MKKVFITLAGFERKDYFKLRDTHGIREPIPTRDAVETLVNENDSAANRGRAYSEILALAKAGALEHNRTTEMVRVRDVEVVVPDQPTPPRDENPPVSPLRAFIAQLTLARIRCLVAIIEIHQAQGGGNLPPRLAENILSHMRKKYHNDAGMLLSANPIRQLLYNLRARGFFENTGEHGVYRIAPAGFELIPSIKKIAANRAAAEPAPSSVTPPEAKTE